MSELESSWWKTACAVVVLCAAIPHAGPAQSFNTLVSFSGTNGATPLYGALVQGADGLLYGTTLYGGANNHGTVFKLTTAGMLTTLYSFCALANCADGAEPYAGLVLATDGNFYGTTAY